MTPLPEKNTLKKPSLIRFNEHLHCKFFSRNVKEFLGIFPLLWQLHIVRFYWDVNQMAVLKNFLCFQKKTYLVESFKAFFVVHLRTAHSSSQTDFIKKYFGQCFQNFLKLSKANSFSSEITGVVSVDYSSAKYSARFSLRCSENKKFLTKMSVV